jgi:MarR family transcriptional regulator, organic hydroperoxide resistance regulator
MTTATKPRLSPREAAITDLGASFKKTMAAVRKLKGRDTHRPGSPSLAACQLLFALADRGELSSGELALAAELSPASATQMLDSLVEFGYVTRHRSSTDRRIVTCSLTDTGRQLVTERRALFEGRWRAALTGIDTAELAITAAVLDRIALMFDEYDA